MARKASFDRDTALKQAMDLFWSKGFHATSLKDIEAALDMRPGSIYAAFGSKEELFRSALDVYFNNTKETFQDTVSAAPTALDGLATHVRNLGQSMQGAAPAKACMLMKTVLETPDDDPILRAAAEDMLQKTEDAFATVFRHAQDRGEITTDRAPAQLASRLQSQILGLQAYAQRSDTSARISDLADDIAQTVEGLAK